MTTGVRLLTYADRLGGDLAALRAVLDGPLADAVGVHILPFYTPFDGYDTGFDPVDHAAVDARLGTWNDVRAIAESREVTADIIVNHVSADSAEFVDWQARGAASDAHGMFLTFDAVFPHGADEASITSFYRPRPGLPFTAYTVAGERRLVWTTFMPSQIDLDVRHPAALAYLDRVVNAIASAGVSVVRLDAVGYAIKTPGSDSFMTKHTLEFVSEIAARLRARGLRVLVEVHAHYSQQLAIAPLVDLVYDFALPPLLLHALDSESSDRLAHWIDIRPHNAVTVLDTHDGIGVIDAGPSGEREGLLSHDEMARLFAVADRATGGHSTLASVVPQWASIPHQINATFPSVVDDDLDYLLCRAVQFFVPGEPQVYYVGLLNGRDDRALFQSTGQGRDVNRHRYSTEEFVAALAQPVPQSILGLMRLRRDSPAFGGEFRAERESDHALALTWTAPDEVVRLDVDFRRSHRALAVTIETEAGRRRLDTWQEFAQL